eukprot:CAMPEP_0175125080 /NCGR_PEP_ID=MMETSP0087-20121206/3124_1 /TAXON_ID=136419 /ORGANISM="Unknown Unknown, Strain D1" /LENGTH=213 /DNA_ID=CAMNT_0016406891 /DNA_START=34 /DNA_END=676 /DNA_ORIENTATION=-
MALRFVCTVLLLRTMEAAGVTESSHVFALNDGTYDEEIAGKIALVDFYAPWCAYCKALAPIWEQLAVDLNQKGYHDVIVGKVDCTLNPDVCTRTGVQGYPTIIMVNKQGTVVPYSGQQTHEDLWAWIEQNVIPLANSKSGASGTVRSNYANAKPRSKKRLQIGQPGFLRRLFMDLAEEMWFGHPFVSATLLVLAGFVGGMMREFASSSEKTPV